MRRAIDRGPPVRAMPERDLAEDDQRTQAAFGVIVRRRHAGIVQKDQPAVRVAVDPLLQRDRLVVVQRAVLQALAVPPATKPFRRLAFVPRGVDGRDESRSPA